MLNKTNNQMEMYKVKKEMNISFENWSSQDLFEYLYFLKRNPNKRNNELQKQVKNYINKY
tara:strand:+ start:96 stop:275 length:180 start_codon:yes stop_codon:yes gene_type:complete